MKSLSARLLLLTVIFVMLAEVLIFVPSVARFRAEYLKDRMDTAHLAVLVVGAAPDGMVNESTTQEILRFVDAHALSARIGDLKLSLRSNMMPDVDQTIMVSEEGIVAMIAEALSMLVRDEDRTIRLVGESPRNQAIMLDLVANDAPLMAEVQAFAWRIFFLSLTISILTAIMVFFVLRRQLVRPLRRLTRNMIKFRQNPEDIRAAIQPSTRRDELGVAERELAAMQTTIRDALAQRKHLAALGTAVAKINHDLRGILSGALVVSDRLETSDDPEVRRIAPGILDAIDRAVALCSKTLGYVGKGTDSIMPSSVPLIDIIQDAAFGLPNGAEARSDIPNKVSVYVDREQAFRIFKNLLRNAAEAGASVVTVTAQSAHKAANIRITDNGPGLPPRAQDTLFQPFEGSAKAGGTGLGLSIARELARAHGGDLTLARTGPEGTEFLLILPEVALED